MPTVKNDAPVSVCTNNENNNINSNLKVALLGPPMAKQYDWPATWKYGNALLNVRHLVASLSKNVYWAW